MNAEVVNEHGYFRTRDGVRLFYSVEGPKNAPPLLFAYGLVCSKLQWKYQMEHFRSQYRVIYMDYRGHGQSDVPADPRTVTIEGLARDMLELLDELKLMSVPVLGHSLGVNIILDLYRLAPERVKALVLANGTPKDPFETMFHHNFLQVFFPFLRLAHGIAPEMLQKFWATQGKNPINREFVALAGFNPKYAKREDINEYLRLTSTVPLEVFLNLLEDFIRYDASPWLHEVRCPTLIVGGERDLITPLQNQRIFHSLIPGSDFRLVPEGSHCPQMEKPDLVNEILGNFLNALESSQERAPRAKAKRPVKKRSKKVAEKNLT